MEDEEMDEKIDQLDKLKKKIHEEGLGISRIPHQTKVDFIALADAEFCSDYGMALKWLVDNAKQSIAIDMMSAKIMELEARISTMAAPKVSAPVRKTLSGKTIGSKEEPKQEEKKDGKV
jgi:hypothetical protein